MGFLNMSVGNAENNHMTVIALLFRDAGARR